LCMCCVTPTIRPNSVKPQVPVQEIVDIMYTSQQSEALIGEKR
jgi:hypothetical protein